jgi:hypothetical protein
MFIITQDTSTFEESLSIFDSMRATRYKITTSKTVMCGRDITVSIESALAASASNGSSIITYYGNEAVAFMRQLAQFIGVNQNKPVYVFLQGIEARKKNYDNESPF